MKKQALALILVLVAVLAGCLAAVVGLRRPTANSAPLRLNLPEGTTYETLCDSLSAKGIEATGTFHLMARALSLHKHVQPGSYLVEPHMRQLTLVRKLRNGLQDPIRLTIGKFRLPSQLNAYLDSKLMHKDFDVSIEDFHLVRPDTYEVYWTITPARFMERMEREYRKEEARWQQKMTDNQPPTTDHRQLSTFKEVVILASIVEEETNRNSEKPLIASVYLNRLRKGMPLQADPTVKYAVGDFALRRILNKHLQTESPFNTYLHTGLPPAPICLPSKASVEAVLNAETTDYLYFCASPDMDGSHRFAATMAQHQRNAAAFHAALNRRGIR